MFHETQEAVRHAELRLTKLDWYTPSNIKSNLIIHIFKFNLHLIYFIKTKILHFTWSNFTHCKPISNWNISVSRLASFGVSFLIAVVERAKCYFARTGFWYGYVRRKWGRRNSNQKEEGCEIRFPDYQSHTLKRWLVDHDCDSFRNEQIQF